jgi:hypothetical protein
VCVCVCVCLCVCVCVCLCVCVCVCVCVGVCVALPIFIGNLQILKELNVRGNALQGSCRVLPGRTS